MRSLLIWLALACLAPGMLGAGLVFAWEYRNSRTQLERSNIQTVRALVQTVDGYFLRAEAAARSLSVASSIAAGDFARFHREASAAAALGNLGGSIALIDPSGQQIVNTLRKSGDPLPRTGNIEFVRQVFQTGQPAISGLYRGSVVRRPIMAVGVPVELAGKVTYVLTINIQPDQFTSILRKQNLPAGHVAAIFDRKGIVAGRTLDPEKFVGQPAPQEFLRQMRNSFEGTLELTTLEGIPVLSAYSISPVTGWGVAIGIPRKVLRAEIMDALAILALGWIALWCLGLGLAWFTGDRIARSVRALKIPAAALGSGQPAASLPPLQIREADEVAQAMAEAARVLEERTSALGRSQGLLRLITNAVPALISYVDPQYRYRLANDHYERWLGLPADRIVGQTVREALGEAVWEQIHPWMARAMAGEAVHFQYQMAYGDGELHWMSVSLTPDREPDGRVRGVVVLGSDITDRVRVELSLRDREEKLGAIVGHSPSALSLKYPDGRYALANPNLQRIHHRDEAEIIGRTDFDLYPEENARAFRANDELVMKTLARQSVEEIVPVDGEARVYMSHIFPVLGPDGTAQYICRISLDITDRKRADEEIRRLNADLEAQVAARTAELKLANDALLQSNMELQHFAHAAAHDLQTPLRSIVSFAQLAQRQMQGRGEEQVNEWLGYVIDNTKRLQLLIQELLAYSRLDALARPFEPVDLRAVFDQVVITLAEPIRETGAEVRCGDLPTLIGDRTQMAQLLQNLIENGIKYRSEKPPRITVAAERQGEKWVFSVEDNGIGIEPKHHERIFKIFRRLHSYQRIPGTGIGLAICQRIVERHGGRIWVESQAGAGSVFHFTLPARFSDPGTPPEGIPPL